MSPQALGNVVDVLRARAADGAAADAYTFLGDGEAETARMSYAGLFTRARAIGAQLQALGLDGERALLVFPPGLEFITAFFGALAGGMIAVPTPGPSQPLHRTVKRLAAIAQDARAAVVLTTAALAPELAALRTTETTRILAIDEIADGLAEAWRPYSPEPGALAFLQYTSGSTGTPKGVMVSHANLAHDLAFLQDGWQHTQQSVGISWLPIFHDMGLLDAVLQPLWNGFRSVLMPPAAFLKRPMRWLEALARYGGTYTSAPNFAFDLCVRKSTAEQRAALDLRRWSAALIAAEPIRERTMEQFARAFAPAGFRWSTFRPGYGLAEATLKVCGTPPGQQVVLCRVDAAALEQHRIVLADEGAPGARTLIGCGDVRSGAFDTTIRIVDPESLCACGPGQVGEIWVRGPGVAQGYWERPEETQRTFAAWPADSDEGPFMRTGDLGFLRDHQLFVTGRVKDLVILFGRNHYPQDLERAAEESHPALRPGCSAAFSVENDEQERLVIVSEIDLRQPADAGVITRAVTLAVADEHEVSVRHVVLVKAGTIHKTSSGKIQRHACKAAYLAGTLDLADDLGAERQAG